MLFGCIFCAGAVLASTCQTRVDKKWDKTTQDRVDTCLYGESDDDGPQTEVVSSLIYSVYPPNKKKAKSSQKEPKKYKKYEEQEAFRELIDQDYYPTFKNDFLPEQSDELAHETAIEALREHREIVVGQEALDEVVERQQKQYAQEQARAKAKAKKAKAKAKQTKAKVTTILADEGLPLTTTDAILAEPSAEDLAAAAHETTDTVTAPLDLSTLNQPPAGEVQQAQALEQDPVAPLPADDDPMKELALNDDLLGPSGFGYNDTDPAFQP